MAINNMSDDDLDLLLTKRLGHDIASMMRLIEKEKRRKLLKQYQGPLALWGECALDTNIQVIGTLDGRDTGGKGGNIKRVTKQLDTKVFNIQAFGKPEPEERVEGAWFQRWENYFPTEGGLRLFDRSWYNRAGVEAAMGFCTEEEYNWFMKHVNQFEKEKIIDQGYHFLKIYLSITKETQKFRLKRRDERPEKSWKKSPIDEQALEKRGYYTLAKTRILQETDSEHAPWIVLDSNDKHLSAVEIMKAIIRTSSEVTSMVENNMGIDLSPNPEIRRTATEEIERMKNIREYPPKKKGFKFRDDIKESWLEYKNKPYTHELTAIQVGTITELHIKPGDIVQSGDILATLTTLGEKHEIFADKSGQVNAILFNFSNGYTPIEFGQPLFGISPIDEEETQSIPPDIIVLEHSRIPHYSGSGQVILIPESGRYEKIVQNNRHIKKGDTIGYIHKKSGKKVPIIANADGVLTSSPNNNSQVQKREMSIIITKHESK